MLGYLKAGGASLLNDVQKIERGARRPVRKGRDLPGVLRIDCRRIVCALPDDRFKPRGAVQVILKYRYYHASPRPFLFSSRFEPVS